MITKNILIIMIIAVLAIAGCGGSTTEPVLVENKTIQNETEKEQELQQSIERRSHETGLNTKAEITIEKDPERTRFEETLQAYSAKGETRKEEILVSGVTHVVNAIDEGDKTTYLWVYDEGLVVVDIEKKKEEISRTETFTMEEGDYVLAGNKYELYMQRISEEAVIVVVEGQSKILREEESASYDEADYITVTLKEIATNGIVYERVSVDLELLYDVPDEIIDGEKSGVYEEGEIILLGNHEAEVYRIGETSAIITVNEQSNVINEGGTHAFSDAEWLEVTVNKIYYAEREEICEPFEDNKAVLKLINKSKTKDVVLEKNDYIVWSGETITLEDVFIDSASVSVSGESKTISQGDKASYASMVNVSVEQIFYGEDCTLVEEPDEPDKVELHFSEYEEIIHGKKMFKETTLEEGQSTEIEGIKVLVERIGNESAIIQAGAQKKVIDEKTAETYSEADFLEIYLDKINKEELTDLFSREATIEVEYFEVIENDWMELLESYLEEFPAVQE